MGLIALADNITFIVNDQSLGALCAGINMSASGENGFALKSKVK